MANMRKETDSLGEVEVPADKLWGAQTQRSLEHFSIGKDLIPREMVTGYATLKKAAANANHAGKLAAAVGDHLVHIHIELRAASRHPHVQREHVVVLAGEDFVAALHDQLVGLVGKPLLGVVDDGGGLLQNRVRVDHLCRNQILTDAEVLKRALSLRAP